MDFSFSQSHRDGFIVAQGFNPGLITIEKTFKSHRDDVIKRKILPHVENYIFYNTLFLSYI